VTREIVLRGVNAKGRVALVDDADYDLVIQHPWCVKESAKAHSGPYAQTSIYVPQKRTVQMHKLITGWPRTDHINHDGLDNRRENLRPATPGQNCANSRKRAQASSIYKGVSLSSGGKYLAAACKGKIMPLGSFDNELHAAMAYDIVAAKLFGEFAHPNFPLPLSDELAAIRDLVMNTPIGNRVRNVLELPPLPPEPRTHCSWGHEMTQDNIVAGKSHGTPVDKCKKCALRYAADYRARQKALAEIALNGGDSNAA
jgi:hypothetical protein